MNRVLLITLIVFLVVCFSGCSYEDAKIKINEKVADAKQEVSNQIEYSIQKTIDNKVENITESIESKINPELGRIRTNMQNIKETVTMYYKINNDFPSIDTIQTFFNAKFSDMEIEYSLSDDKKIANIKYVGDKYDNKKLPDIIIDKSVSK